MSDSRLGWWLAFFFFFFWVCAGAVPSAEAQLLPQEQREPVQLKVESLFGEELTQLNQWAPIRVTLTNRTQSPMRGRIAVKALGWQAPSAQYETAVDLPASAERSIQMTIFLPESGGSIDARYLVDGRLAGQGTAPLPYSGVGPGIVVLAESSRLANQLEGIELSVPQRYNGEQQVELPVGRLSFDARTGDPIAPTTPLGYAGLRLVVARSSDLERLAPAAREALRGWLATGGRLLVFARTPEAVKGPVIRSLLGSVAWQTSDDASDAGGVLRPDDATDWVDESFGGSRRLGFGRVYLATFDGTTPPKVDDPRTREVIRSVAVSNNGVEAPLLPFSKSAAPWDEWDGSRVHQALTRALDPNESFRPALGFVAVLLLLYVVVVGPLNFRWIAKRNRPILALITTPLAAIACLALMLLVGYIGKGITTRYRAVGLIDAVEGYPLASSRRYHGLFLTRPTTFDVKDVSGTRLLPIGSPRMPRVELDGDVGSLRELQGGLWETLFIREDSVVDLHGAIDIEVEGTRLDRVRNGTDRPLLGAVLLAVDGNLYPVGDVAAGATATIGTTPLDHVSFPDDTWGVDLTAVSVLASTMDARAEGDRDGLAALLNEGTRVVGGPTPVLYARLGDGEATFAGRFARDRDLQLVRVVVRVPTAPVWVGNVKHTAGGDGDMSELPGGEAGGSHEAGADKTGGVDVLDPWANDPSANDPSRNDGDTDAEAPAEGVTLEPTEQHIP